jgi:hypothetical protein
MWTLPTALLVAAGLTACESPVRRDGDRDTLRDGDRTSTRGYGDNQARPMGGMRDQGEADKRLGDQYGTHTRSQGDESKVTQLNQGNNAADLETTQVIRRALMDVEGISMWAKNITIITRDQVVTLKGTVKTAADRDAVLAAARSAAGQHRIDDQIEIQRSKTALTE